MGALFGPSWNMFIAMIAGMGLGMVLSMAVAFPLGALFGAMEVMVPVMTTGMVAGMVVSMAAAVEEVSIARSAVLGLYSGGGTLLFCYVANIWVKGSASKWTS